MYGHSWPSAATTRPRRGAHSRARERAGKPAPATPSSSGRGAQAYYLLGDYPAALRALGEFGPKEFERTRFDMRWGLLPRVRLLRGPAYERLGESAEAERENRLAASQWRAADPALRAFVEQASVGLERIQRVLASQPAGAHHELSAGQAGGGQCGTPPPGDRRP